LVLLVSILFISSIFCGDCGSYTSKCDCLLGLNNTCGYCVASPSFCTFKAEGEASCLNVSGAWITDHSFCTSETTTTDTKTETTGTTGGTPSYNCGSFSSQCDCVLIGCGYCSNSLVGSFCKPKVGLESGEGVCHEKNGTWKTTDYGCGTPVPPSCGVASGDFCNCTQIVGCAFCANSSFGSFCKANGEYGQQLCKNNSGTWQVEPIGCSGTPAPAPNPIPPCQFSTFCDCTKSFECGWCSGTYVVEGTNKSFAYCKIIKVIEGSVSVHGETVCHQNGGTWAKGSQEICKAPVGNEYYVAKVEGVLNTKPNETTTQIIAGVIQKSVADTLGIAPEKVQVIVSVTDNADGTSGFSVTVKVSTTVLTEGSFDTGMNSIVSSNLQSSIQSQGVDVKSIDSVTVTPINNYAGKLFVSLLVALMIVWM